MSFSSLIILSFLSQDYQLLQKNSAQLIGVTVLVSKVTVSYLPEIGS